MTCSCTVASSTPEEAPLHSGVDNEAPLRQGGKLLTLGQITSSVRCDQRPTYPMAKG